MSGFSHDVAGGNGALIATQVKSPNYVHGSTGWAIFRDGSAEFHDIILPSGQGVSVFFAGSPPVTTHTGDLWYDTSNGLLLHYWNGSSWVAQQVGTGAIANGAITNPLLGSAAVGTSNIANAAITNALMAAAAVGTSNIASGAVTTAQIAAAAGILGSQLSSSAGITGTQLASGTITGTQLNASVTARSLGGITTTIAGTAPGSPVTGDIWIDSANGYQLQQWSGSAWTAVTFTGSDVLSAGSVTATQIANATITATQLAASVTARSLGGITTTLAASAPGSPAAGDIWINSANGYQINQYSGSAWVAVTWTATDVIAAGTITASLITAATITGSLIAAGTITASNIAANTITASQIASGTITAAQIAAGTITASQIASGTITATQIASATITGSLIAASTITGGNIAAGTITASNIQAGTITSSLIAANAIVAGLVAAGAIDGQVINGVTINGATINATSNGVFVYSGSGSTILNANPAFATGITNWTAINGSISYTTPTIGGHDTMQLALTNGPIGMAGTFDGRVQSEFEAVTAGSSYLATFQVQLSAVTGGAFLLVDWYNSGGTLLSQSTIASPSGTSAVWTTYSGVVTAPAGATQMKLEISGNAAANTAFVNVGQAQIATSPTLINSIAPAAGTDPYSDNYLIGIATYGPNGEYLQLASNGSFPAIIMEPASVTHLTTQPQIYGSATNAGAVNEFNEMILSSGKSGHDDAALQLFGESADATIAANAVIEFGGQAVVFVTRNGMQANQPGTSDTPETWHSMSITGGWTVTTYAQYKKYPDNTVAVRAYNLTPGTLTNGTSIWTIPSGYIPATTQAFPVVVRSGTAIGTVPRVEVQSGGTMIIEDFQTTASSLYFNFRYALD